jgi:hypothetical protein
VTVESTAIHAGGGGAISGASGTGTGNVNDDVSSDAGGRGARGEMAVEDDRCGCGEDGGDTSKLGSVDRSVRMTEYPIRVEDAEDMWL